MTATGELVMDVGTVLDGESAVKEGLIAVSYTHLDVYKRQLLKTAK